MCKNAGIYGSCEYLLNICTVQKVTRKKQRETNDCIFSEYALRVFQFLTFVIVLL